MKTIGTLTAEEMLAKLDDQEEREPVVQDDGARTIKEWAEFWKMDRNKASGVVDQFIERKLMERVDRKRPMLNGRSRLTPCFVWVGDD